MQEQMVCLSLRIEGMQRSIFGLLHCNYYKVCWMKPTWNWPIVRFAVLDCTVAYVINFLCSFIVTSEHLWTISLMITILCKIIYVGMNTAEKILYLLLFIFFRKLCKYLLREFISAYYILYQKYWDLYHASSTSQKEINCCGSLNFMKYIITKT
jgi:hypothetical protein